MSEVKKTIEEVADELSKLFKEQSQEAKEVIADWSLIILELKNKQSACKDEKELARLKISEQFAWNAVYSIAAMYSKQVEKQAWMIIEKLLLLLRSVLLSA